PTTTRPGWWVGAQRRDGRGAGRKHPSSVAFCDTFSHKEEGTAAHHSANKIKTDVSLLLTPVI
ncbi:hypothetical protein, partial [Mesorhizobium sp.]|uniref:hypothetical protein n=1 Tax=Mesorhizobium sp. TaxID=1871066 RepID=UPI00257C4F12